MNHTVQGPKSIHRLPHNMLQLGEVRNVRPDDQYFRASTFDAPQDFNLGAGGVFGIMSFEPAIPLATLRKIRTTKQNQTRMAGSGQMLRQRQANVAEAAGDQIYASFSQSTCVSLRAGHF